MREEILHIDRETALLFHFCVYFFAACNSSGIMHCCEINALNLSTVLNIMNYCEIN